MDLSAISFESPARKADRLDGELRLAKAEINALKKEIEELKEKLRKCAL
jgi:hypothetical protein